MLPIDSSVQECPDAAHKT